MDLATLRTEFPVCEHKAYLNAGTCGPLPRSAIAASTEIAEHALAEGRAMGYYEAYIETRDRLRAAYAGVLGADPADVSVTTSTSQGMVRVLLGLGLAAGDEVLIAGDEHPGLLGPLAFARRQLGIAVREVPLAQIAASLTPATRLVACSHVGWTTGEVAPALEGIPAEVPVLLDGAQGVGAIPFEVSRLGCAFYAGSGQKWLCGPVGTGMLWVAPAWRDRLRPLGPTYMNLEDPAAGLDAQTWPDGRAHDEPSLALETVSAALAAHDTLAAAGFAAIADHARTLAAALAGELAAAGRDVAPRGDSTLVSWHSADPEAEAGALLEAGVVVRSFPGLPYVRASVGGWNDRADVDRLLSISGVS